MSPNTAFGAAGAVIPIIHAITVTIVYILRKPNLKMIDRVIINIKSGNGGDGAISGRREKYVPRGGPDGGDGGNGGGVFLVADPNMNTLLEYRYRRHFSAEDGRRGDGKSRHGANGRDISLRVPVGTQVWAEDAEDEDGGGSRLLGDLDAPGQRLLAAKGGAGGAGNARYATSTNQFPLLAQSGAAGEALTLRLELKLLADVGIIGSPNAGKSSLLAAASAARPKVADYPFTTLEPSLGVVEARGETFVMVDIPGLIEGASAGVGLGLEFLRHVERARVLIHLVDGSLDDPAAEYAKINAELAEYGGGVERKPQILAVNKLDLTDVSVLRDDLADAFAQADAPPPLFVSAATREGVGELMDAAFDALRSASETPAAPETAAIPDDDDGDFADAPILRPAPRRRRPQVYADGEGGFIVEWQPAERMAGMVDLDDWSARMQFYDRLRRAGVIEALENAGVGSGDVVRIGGVEWRWE